jgi:hypothetical protein
MQRSRASSRIEERRIRGGYKRRDLEEPGQGERRGKEASMATPAASHSRVQVVSLCDLLMSTFWNKICVVSSGKDSFRTHVDSMQRSFLERAPTSLTFGVFLPTRINFIVGSQHLNLDGCSKMEFWK